MYYSSLATKYRPTEFTDVVSQSSTIKILERQIETSTFRNCYIFCGMSGCGKTTIARIFANKINKGVGEPIEIDGSSSNSVNDVRMIIDNAQERSLDSEYKVIIIDECHSLTNQAWQALLKTIEEPPKHTLFFFCTTDPQKIPATIMNRCQVYNLSRVDSASIKNRLKYISSLEGYSLSEDGADQIVRMADGSMRQAIAYLDKCKDYSTDITVENVIACLGDCSYVTMFRMTYYITHKDKVKLYNLIDELYNSGVDLKVFMNSYFKFVLQLAKYSLFKSMDGVELPKMYEEDVKVNVSCVTEDYFSNLLDKLLEVKQAIKVDTDVKTTLEVMLSHC